jgi:chorismate dehydratase
MNPKLLGIPGQLHTQPLTRTLRSNKDFQLVEDSRPNIAKQLREQELSAALLSPLDYAKESSDYCIVPGVATVSPEGNNSIIVRFREGVESIQSLAVDPNFASEIVLAKIILAEAFDIEPTIVPMIASPEGMLQKTDAALLVGDSAFRESGKTERLIDIVEEWNEMTGLPLVHALWCGREADLTKEDILQLQQAALKGSAGIADIILEVQKEDREASREFLESFSYDLNNEAKAGLGEFMKYLYYHGITPDVSELNFYNTEDDDLLSDISQN